MGTLYKSFAHDAKQTAKDVDRVQAGIAPAILLGFDVGEVTAQKKVTCFIS